jgi:hypothetical protein
MSNTNIPNFSWSEITCGHSCWYAKEIDCKCSCGSKNHGCMKTANGVQPERMKKTGGHTYYLVKVGNRIELMQIINDLLPIITGKKNANSGWYDCNPAKTGNPLMLNYASLQNCQKWAELSQYKHLEENSDIEEKDFYFNQPSILWRRSDIDENLFG